MLKFKNVLSLFDGASCAQIALKRAGISYEKYYASEINENAIKVSSHNFPNTIHLGDVTKIDFKKLPKIDCIFAGSPCKNFSAAGLRNGMMTKCGKKVHSYLDYMKYKKEGKEFTESCLFWELIRAIHETGAKDFFSENTKMEGFYLDLITKELGVNPVLLNSSLLTAQNRERHYWTTFKGFEMPKDRGITFDSIVPNGVSSGYRGRDFGDGKGYVRTYSKRKDGKANCLVCSPYSTNYVDINGERRVISVDEAIKLQTWPKNYLEVEGLTKAAKYELLGNGWTVDAVSYFLKGAKKHRKNVIYNR